MFKSISNDIMKNILLKIKDKNRNQSYLLNILFLQPFYTNQ